jgi:hypothetical protein
MSSKSSDPSNTDSGRDRLPFEPGTARKTSDKKAKPSAPTPIQEAGNSAKSAASLKGAIPDTVSRRMVRRMALLSGIPTFLGMMTFVASYLVVTRGLFPLPNYAVVAVSMGFFGLGVLGLSYGVLSASWEEETPGSLVGWSEFTTNFGRMTEAWRSRQ